MLFRKPLGLMSFKDFGYQNIDFTLDLKGELYNVPIPLVAPTFDFSELTVIACPEDAPADVIVLPTMGNIDFKTMGSFVSKKTLRIVVPNLTLGEFKFKYGGK